MKISVICFTKRGLDTEKKLEKGLKEAGHWVRSWVSGRYALQAASGEFGFAFEALKEGGLSEWTGQQFGILPGEPEKSAVNAGPESGGREESAADAVIFVGACGIAVRAIAPYVRDKRTDPAVVSIDEAGQFAVPLLSGHIGGANGLAVLSARILSAQPVITTATDVEKRFAVDVFAKEHGLVIDDMNTAKEISAAVLGDEPVGVFCDFPFEGQFPDGLYRDMLCRRNLWITVLKRSEARAQEENGKENESGGEGKSRILRLIPKCVAVGVGCRRGTPEEKIREILSEAFLENQVDMRSICTFASIDIKSGEAGICGLARNMKVPFLTYSAEELETIPGTYTESEFVKKTTGVGNVCERSAMAACLEVSGESRILFPKFARDGVTVAAACFPPKLFDPAPKHFDGDGKENGKESAGNRTEVRK